MGIFLWFVVRLWEANANSRSKVPKVCCLRVSIDVNRHHEHGNSSKEKHFTGAGL